MNYAASLSPIYESMSFRDMEARLIIHGQSGSDMTKHLDVDRRPWYIGQYC